ncbi:MAG: ABC transporter ATP-binding protein/permease [Chloroflexi bacterium]|nr:ABC transporter ATP-binding protein/permease [Chloroflexota bacterium]
MGFIMDGLDAEEYDRQYSDGELVKRIWHYFKPRRKLMLIVAFAIMADSLASTAIPITISWGVDEVERSGAGANLALPTLVLIGVGSIAWVFNLIRRWYSSRAIGDVVLSLREDAFNAVMDRDLSFYDRFPSGKIVSRVTSDTQAFTQVVDLTMNLLSQVLLIMLLIGYLFFVNVTLTLITLALAPLIIIVSLAFRNIARKTVTQSRRVAAEVNKHIQETISGIRVAKTFRQENAVYDEFSDVNHQSYKINLVTGYTFSSIFPILNLMAGFGTVALVYYGGLRAQAGTISAGEWFLFIQGIGLFWFPLTSIASFWSQFQLGLAAGERIFALLDAEPNVVQHDNVKPATIKGDITFENMTFAYKEGETVLDDFSLHIPAGQTMALVGHTGSGKSSITKLVARFYEFQSGKLLIDGQDIRSFHLEAYRKHIGFVTQTPFLFDGTVVDNIRYGKQEASTEEVFTVAQQVGGGDWIRTLPRGLHTEVGERGGNLSMGQRQLVALARVLLQNPSIFVLDEATASIDPLTETLIQEGLDVVMQNRTSIIIAHRLSTIRNADRIIVLDHGKIIEEGTHNQLLERGGHYADLYNTYFRHQSLDYIEQAGQLLA